MTVKRVLVAAALALASLAGSPAGAHHGTTLTATYVGTDFFFPFDCSDPTSALGVVCFDVSEGGLSSIHVDVADVSGIPQRAWVELHDPTATFIGGQRVCETGDVPVPAGTTVGQIVVHIELFSDETCDGQQFIPSTVGEVSLTFA